MRGSPPRMPFMAGTWGTKRPLAEVARANRGPEGGGNGSASGLFGAARRRDALADPLPLAWLWFNLAPPPLPSLPPFPPALFRFLEPCLTGDVSAIFVIAAVSKSKPEPTDAPDERVRRERAAAAGKRRWTTSSTIHDRGVCPAAPAKFLPAAHTSKLNYVRGQVLTSI
mmetsp:Transcript_807/g.1254  ORF Transcript_807/g.1254 Transcript_807/m.1254 type:complete len:169 (-) Transcript_807:140-646(-)